MQTAPVLDLLAAKLAGTPVRLREDPTAWAYSLREAIALARPTWFVTHHDLTLEAAAVPDPDDVLDTDLTAAGPTAAALELTATLVGIDPSATVAASIAGPLAMARALGAEALDDCTEDCGDALAGLAAAHAERGAKVILVWEPDVSGVDPELLAGAHVPIVKRLALAGAESVLCGGPGLDEVGYTRVARREGGTGAVLLDPDAFRSDATLEAELARAAGLAGDGVAITDGPIPADTDLTALRRLGA